MNIIMGQLRLIMCLPDKRNGGERAVSGCKVATDVADGERLEKNRLGWKKSGEDAGLRARAVSTRL